MIVSIGKSSSYRFVGGCCRYLLQRGSRDEVSISARRDYAGATNNPRSPEMHLGWKASKRCVKTLTVLTHSAPRSLSENRSLGQDNRVRERKKAATIGCADAPCHEYECPDKGAWDRNSHSWPYSALASIPFLTLSRRPTTETRRALPYLHSRDFLRFPLSFKSLTYTRIPVSSWNIGIYLNIFRNNFSCINDRCLTIRIE